MQVNEYIKKNLFSLNFNVLSDIFKENGGELTEEVKSYLKETPWNTNFNVLNSVSGGGKESWPKTIHIIIDGGYKMANDSDFSTFAEAYQFITNRWEIRSEECTSDYIILKVGEQTIESSGGYATITSNDVCWYANSNVYRLTEDNFRIVDDE